MNLRPVLGVHRASIEVVNNRLLHPDSFMKYKGIVIEESLEDRAVLSKLKVVKKKVSMVTAKHKTPWLERWTLDTIELDEDQARSVAEAISRSIDSQHGSWFADFLNDRNHFVIFRDKVFLIDRRSKEQYDEAVKYGLSIGIPAYQLDFANDLIS